MRPGQLVGNGSKRRQKSSEVLCHGFQMHAQWHLMPTVAWTRMRKCKQWHALPGYAHSAHDDAVSRIFGKIRHVVAA